MFDAMVIGIGDEHKYIKLVHRPLVDEHILFDTTIFLIEEIWHQPNDNVLVIHVVAQVGD